MASSPLKEKLWWCKATYVFMTLGGDVVDATNELEAVWKLAQDLSNQRSQDITIYNSINDELVGIVHPRPIKPS